MQLKSELRTRVVKLQICEIIYERNFENNFIAFFNGLYIFHIIKFYNF